VITAHKDPAGNVKFISTIIRDMTHRYEIERALRALDRRKDEFLATLAHELRNPLAPIATSALILSQPEVDLARVQRTSEIITRQVGHMTKLLDDLLDVSRVTRGLIHLQQAPVRLVDVVQDAIEQAMPVVSAKHHALHAQPVPEALVVTGDKTRLVQVLVNLLNNAARYTPEGGNIRLDVLASGAAVLVKVSDDGIGIPADMQERIFEIFTQAQRSHGEAYGGLGLGLSLARSIAQLHGGDISAASQGPGRGSTFTFRLPLRADEESRSAD